MFTKEQILEIQKKLEAAGMKDSQFPVATSVSGSEEFSILQDAQNKRLGIKTFTDYISLAIQDIVDAAVSELEEYIEEGENRDVSLTVESNVPNSDITINGERVNAVIVKRGEAVSISVTADGYIPFSEVVNIERTQILKITLNKASYTPPEPDTVNFTINPIPSDSIVRINGVERKTVTVEAGTEVSWEVSKEGYITQDGTYVVNSDYTMEVVLEPSEPSEVSLTVIATPSEATVMLDEQERTSITVPPGTSVHIEVSAQGYDSYSEDYIVNKTETKNVVLKERTEVSWSNLALSQAEGSSNIKAVPNSGGEISLSAKVTVNYSNDETETRDVTSQVVWEVEGDGCTSNGGGTFTWASNPGSSQRSATITGSVEGPGSSSLESSIQTIQIGSEGYVTLNPDSLNYDASGGIQNIQVSSNTAWDLK